MRSPRKRKSRTSPRNLRTTIKNGPSYYVCPACRVRYHSRVELISHLQFSTNTQCQEHLCRCNYCPKMFESQRALDRHIAMSPRCCKIHNLPDILNTIGASDSVTASSGKPSSKAVSTLGVKQYSATVERNVHFCSKLSELSSSVNVGSKKSCAVGNVVIDPMSQMKKFVEMRDNTRTTPIQVSSFVGICETSNIMLSIDPSYILQSRKLTNQEEFILSLIETTDFVKLSVMGNIKIIRNAIMNAAANSWLDGSVVFLRGYHNSRESVSQFEIDSVLTSFAIVWKQKQVVTNCVRQSSQQREYIRLDLESDDDTSIAGVPNEDVDDHDGQSLVYDLQFDGNLSDYEEQQIDVIVPSVEDKSLLLYQTEVISTRTSSVYTICDMANLELYELLRNSGAPTYLFDKVQQWSEKYAAKGMWDGGVTMQRRSTFIDNMVKKVYGSEFNSQMKPQSHEVHLPSGGKLDVVACSIRHQLVSLLCDDVLMHDENLLLNPVNPFLDLREEFLGDLNTGWWYSETKAQLCSNPDKDLLLPIIFYIDESNVDKSGRLQVHPVTITLGLFKRRIRNISRSWRTIGYIESLEKSTGNDDGSKLNAEMKLNDHHAILDFILKDLRQLQGQGSGFSWQLELGGQKFDVVFKVAVQLVIGDCKGNDALCGRVASHSLKCAMLCRECKVRSVDGDDPYHICQFISKSDFDNKSRKQLREDMSYYSIENAFNKLHFGARTEIVNQVTPAEPLHGFKLGLCKYMYEEFEKDIAPTTLRVLNKAVKNISKICKNQSRKDVPSMNCMRNGVSKPKTLSGDEQFARTFTIWLALLIPDVLKSLATEDRYRRETSVLDDGSRTHQNVSIGAIGRNGAKKWLQLFTETVCVHYWLMAPEHCRDIVVSSDGNEPIAQQRMRRYLKLYKDVVNRQDGNGLNIPKFHQMLHYNSYIAKYGSVLNFDGGRGESIARETHSDPGKKTQRRYDTFLKQLADNYHNDMIIKEASQLQHTMFGTVVSQHIPIVGVHHSQNYLDNEEPVAWNRNGLCGSRFQISYDELRGTDSDDSRDVPDIELKWITSKVKGNYNERLVQMIGERLYKRVRTRMNRISVDSVVDGFTEYKKDNNVFRAHPSYRSEGAWYDWALLKFDEQEQYVPARIKMFLDFTDCKFVENDNDNDEFADLENTDVHPTNFFLKSGQYVVVECAYLEGEDPARVQNRYRVANPIATRFRLEGKWVILPVEVISSPAFVVAAELKQGLETSSDFFYIHEQTNMYSHHIRTEM
jgi:hypothetical protein